jgi:hypothetical protein
VGGAIELRKARLDQDADSVPSPRAIDKEKAAGLPGLRPALQVTPTRGKHGSPLYQLLTLRYHKHS